MLTGRLIGIDWGSSSFRACLMGDEGQALDDFKSDRGILAVQDKNFDAVFDTVADRWPIQARDMPILISGMITSRNGWVETRYLPLPVGLAELAENLAPFSTRSGRRVHFVTGIAHSVSDGRPDVMRGEETELAGLLEEVDITRIVILPGTHSKWVWVKGGRIIDFETYMTGEFFDVLRNHSIIGKLAVDGGSDAGIFLQGARLALEEAGSVLSKVFSARTLALFDRLQPAQIPDYLSGLLIGDEFSSGLQRHPDSHDITLVARKDLAERYEKVAALSGVKAQISPTGMAHVGQWKIAKQAGLI